MGDGEVKIEYKPEELKEINRILSVIPEKPLSLSTVVAEKPADRPAPAEAEKGKAPEYEIEEPESAEEIPDITDLVHDMEAPLEEEFPEIEPEEEPVGISDEMMEDITAVEPEETAEEELPASGEELDFGIPEFEEESPGEKPAEAAEYSPLDELDAIASEESPAAGEEIPFDEMFPGVEGLEEIGKAEPAEMEEAGTPADIFEDLDMPSIEEAGAMEELSADEAEFPSIEDTGEVTLPGEIEDVGFPDLEEKGDFEFTDGIEEAPAKKSAIMEKGEPDDIDEIPDIPIEDVAPAPAAARRVEVEGTADLSESELTDIKKALLLFNPGLRTEIINIILNDVLPREAARMLVDMLLSGRREDEVRKFVEQNTGKRIKFSGEDVSAGRRVISSRPEYTLEGKKRKKLQARETGIVAIVAISAVILGFLAYQFVYKPIMAKNIIDEGVGIILKKGEPGTEKMMDYGKAEEMFRDVNTNYAKDYLYGYNEYARAYFEKGEYEFALGKLNKAYIDIKKGKRDIETINNLGRFYSKVPQNYYDTIKSRVPDYYYRGVTPKPDKTQLQVAIDFYRRALNIKPENIDALYGIGNAYYSQGKYNNAKKYYEKITLAYDDNIVGYAGLINLYIERDDLPKVLLIHSKIKYREMITEMPSALLGKLAAYYLAKKRTDDLNIRVDYGILTSKVKDIYDDPYPVVQSVLDYLKEKDLDYPPLYLHNARLYRELKNFSMMERSLKTAIEKEPNYFGALHLLGKYYYLTREPKKAYEYFDRALNAYHSRPKFAREDFYYETEEIGDTYLMLGNFFYYFFDRVKFHAGDELEETLLDQETEELGNYEIARSKYEKALEEGTRTPELFYNLGRIYYIKGQYEKAAMAWRNLYEDFIKNPELMFALGNAFYYMNNLESAKGEYLNLISIFENRADDMQNVKMENSEQIKLFQTLASSYNNLGAIYQRQNKETKSNICYWKAIDYSNRIDRKNEFARVNLTRAFKPGREGVQPLIDKVIPYSINWYTEGMR